jgi:hypothetical protein
MTADTNDDDGGGEGSESGSSGGDGERGDGDGMHGVHGMHAMEMPRDVDVVATLRHQNHELRDKLRHATAVLSEVAAERAAAGEGVGAKTTGSDHRQLVVGLYKLSSDDPFLESAWFQPLNLKCDILVSNFAFKCNLCRYIVDEMAAAYCELRATRDERDRLRAEVSATASGALAARVEADVARGRLQEDAEEAGAAALTAKAGGCTAAESR